ncbi:COX assembly mitochondrial protein homolog isoform X2 [Bemisia tabaci]|uniref:COX assembly mitochondrial protein homolog isoform X2 n=1 Tax=Bemisia tabaci TaxID=7038 RepID=UPI0008F9A476|nr:PREDICTED: COX assembly mitochondrial protein homolog isoform X2 [Bemisia tabaci]
MEAFAWKNFFKGDPDDRTLRKVESEVLVKERMRVKARKELCEPFNLAFANCAKEHGLFMPFSCQEQGQNLKNCIRKYFEDPEFEKKMQEEYLEERAEYRRTGISKKKRERMEALSQLNAQANQQQSK